MKTKLFAFLVLALFSALNCPFSTAFAQGTAFTYQGRLTDSGAPANGRYDFIFLVFDAPSGGSSLGGAVNINGIGVSNGLFTVALDFGSLPFTGPQRWLQIRVSTNGSGIFATLAPRQEITHAPYATYANIAATVTNGAVANAQLAINAVGSANIQTNAVSASQIVSGQVVKSVNGLTDGVSITQGANVTINTVGNSLQISAPAGGLNLPFSGSASSSNSIFTLANSGTGPAGVFLGKVGVGTTDPQFPLDVAGPVRFISVGHGAEVLWLGIERSWVFRQSGVGPGTALELASIGGGGNKNFVINTAGFVGVGTIDPQAKLDVYGDIRLGPSGQFLATSGEENLRIVRGEVTAAGGIREGAGFTVSRAFQGSHTYFINFNTPFQLPPSVVATAAARAGVGPFFFATAVAFSGDSAGEVAEVNLFDPSNPGVPVDGDFHFIAIGPR